MILKISKNNYESLKRAHRLSTDFLKITMGKEGSKIVPSTF
jgi:hypothetical protein